MATHRLVIWRHERLLGHFDSTTPWSEEAVKDIAGRHRQPRGTPGV